MTNNASVGGTFSLTGAGTFGSTLAVVGLLTAATTTFTGDVALSGKKITGVASPTADADAANKVYVDSVAQGLSLKDSVRAGTTANITLSGEQTIDGVSLVVGNRVLVKDQTDQTKNGIYVVASGSWSRSTDADASSEVTSGMFTFITEGTLNANSGWVLTTTGAITLGTSLLTFTQFSGAGQITAGTGITKSGNTLDVVGTTNRITANADSIDIASTYVGQTSITTVGTLTSGSLGAGFGNINIGASSITGGVATFSSIVGSAINGTGDLTISARHLQQRAVGGRHLPRQRPRSRATSPWAARKLRALLTRPPRRRRRRKRVVPSRRGSCQGVGASRILNITLSGTQTIDGVTAVAGDRVLVMGQTTHRQTASMLSPRARGSLHRRGPELRGRFGNVYVRDRGNRVRKYGLVAHRPIPSHQTTPHLHAILGLGRDYRGRRSYKDGQYHQRCRYRRPHHRERGCHQHRRHLRGPVFHSHGRYAHLGQYRLGLRCD